MLGVRDSGKINSSTNYRGIAKHNEVMAVCMKTALAKHPGAIVEIEMETEDGRPIFDIDIQGADGKHWEIECDAELATVIEDNVDKD